MEETEVEVKAVVLVVGVVDGVVVDLVISLADGDDELSATLLPGVAEEAVIVVVFWL